MTDNHQIWQLRAEIQNLRNQIDVKDAWIREMRDMLIKMKKAGLWMQPKEGKGN